MGITFIGGGLMGEAIIKGLVKKRVVKPEEITVNELSKERLLYLEKTYHIRRARDNKSYTEGSDILVIAVKPQDFPLLAKQLSGNLGSKMVVLSIMAAVPIEKIKTSLSHKKVIRAMPNMPAQIGEGITVWTAAPEVTVNERDRARLVLASLGKELYVSQEKYVEMATALSGSGPAYVYVFIESMIDAGVHIGLPRHISQELVIKTVLGSAKTLEALSKHPAELKNMVTSPGGTTTEGLRKLESGAIRHLLLEAVAAGFEKAKRLGN